jgi:mRNA interferase MazF
MSFPRRGDVFWVNLDPTIGAEIRKVRPCVVVSPDEANRSGPLIIVAPITKVKGKKVYFHEILLPKGSANLEHDSKIKVFQLRCIDKRRLGDQKVGSLSQALIVQLNEKLTIVTGVY